MRTAIPIFQTAESTVMRRSKRTTLLILYGAMALLVLLGYLLDSTIYIVAIIGLCTVALFQLYEQITVAAEGTMSVRAKLFQFRLFVLLLALSVFGFATAYFFFDNIEWSGFMLGLSAICIQTLSDHYNR